MDALPSRAWRAVGIVAVAAVLGWAAWLVLDDSPEVDGRATDGRATDGPLSGRDVLGGQAFYAPRSLPARWVVSQGSFPLCTSGDDVTLEGVRPSEHRHPPQAMTPWVLSDASTPARSQFVTFGSVLGSPPDFSEPYASQGLAGSYEPAEGVVVDDPCPSPYVTEGGSELVVAVETLRAGARVPYFWIDYRVGDEPYTLRVDWEMIMCGTEVRAGCGGRVGSAD